MLFPVIYSPHKYDATEMIDRLAGQNYLEYCNVPESIKKQYAAAIPFGSTIVNKARLVTDDVIYHREQKERLDNLCRIISEEWEQVDPSSVSATWLDKIVDRFNHPEKYVTVEEKDDAARIHMTSVFKDFIMKPKCKTPTQSAQ